MVDVIPEKLLRAMHEDMVDSANIASSALALAANRSADLNIPVQITLLTLKVLIEINIERNMKDRELPKEVMEIARRLGIDPPKTTKVATKEMEKLIRAWVEQARFKEVEIEGVT